MPSSWSFVLTSSAVLTSWNPGSGWCSTVLATSISQSRRASIAACAVALSSSTLAMWFSLSRRSALLGVRCFCEHAPHERQVGLFGHGGTIFGDHVSSPFSTIGEQVDDRHRHGLGAGEHRQVVVLHHVVFAVSPARGRDHIRVD